MWTVTNFTPYSTQGTWIQDRDANSLWLVVVKATFTIRADGSTAIAENQIPPFMVPQPYDRFDNSSLRYEADLHGLKACTDIVLNGSAWAPRGRVARVVDVRMSVGGIDKRLRVFGDRIWERSAFGTVRLTEPIPFGSLPIRYERAYGGWDAFAPNPQDHRLEDRNPVGVGFAMSAQACVGKRAPNIEHPAQLIAAATDRPAPAGFGAISCHWSPRRERAGTYDDDWLQKRFPLWAEDFDQRYHNCAPADQQADRFLIGGERVELSNLTADGQLAFALPRIHPTFKTHFGADVVTHRAQLATVVIEPDARRLILVWQTSVVGNGRIDQLDETVVLEKTVL
ncbi:DUF2169 domain-containing protein [Caballeronia sp. LZ029]|uniref:DUF2169 family type VI secretion system accessory protein n=1 Tax=Caballeronia sp. LZ029 TaxID=3038564 RepID=UPI002855954B|nr:DUF2169 domain-containing protein [Caballeronia sp. LZ029]MDR5744598.1 DUF2169 domain-containing protein [Caballeronia sp. LZ029]